MNQNDTENKKGVIMNDEDEAMSSNSNGSMQGNELAIIDGIPATSFHTNLIQLPRFRSFHRNLCFHNHVNHHPKKQKQQHQHHQHHHHQQQQQNQQQQQQQQQSFLIQKDCTIAFTARPKLDDEAYSSGSTFFIPSQMKPRCLLEAFALDIFKTHVISLQTMNFPNNISNANNRMISFDPERSGAEWWTLVMDASEHISPTPPSTRKSSSRVNSDSTDTAKPMKTTNSSDSNSSCSSSSLEDDESKDSNDEEDDVGMHFDADYGLEDELPSLIHPHLSTVTYLSDKGCPTLILEKISPPPEDVLTKHSLNGPIQHGYLSYPQFGKHVVFDGRLLHGASASFFPSLASSGCCATTNINTTNPPIANTNADITDMMTKRITFMVNIWFNHIPIDADILPEKLLHQMTPCPWYHYDTSWIPNTNSSSFNDQTATSCPSSSSSKRFKKSNSIEDFISPYTFQPFIHPDTLPSFSIFNPNHDPNDSNVNANINANRQSNTQTKTPTSMIVQYPTHPAGKTTIATNTTIKKSNATLHKNFIEKQIQTVICGREVTMSLSCQPKDINQVIDHVCKTMNDTVHITTTTTNNNTSHGSGTVRLQFKNNSLMLRVGKEVMYSSGEEDDDDEYEKS